MRPQSTSKEPDFAPSEGLDSRTKCSKAWAQAELEAQFEPIFCDALLLQPVHIKAFKGEMWTLFAYPGKGFIKLD